MIRKGDSVVVTAQWSSFFGMKGKVTQVHPHPMIVIEGDSYPIRVGEKEIALDLPSNPNLTGAE